jgi:hypothetical protein
MIDDIVSFIALIISLLIAFSAAFVVLNEPETPPTDWPWNVLTDGSKVRQCPGDVFSGYIVRERPPNPVLTWHCDPWRVPLGMAATLSVASDLLLLVCRLASSQLSSSCSSAPSAVVSSSIVASPPTT